MCSSSGGQNCVVQHLVSSHSVGGRPVRRLSESSLNLRTGRPSAECDDTRCCIIQFWPPGDEHIVLETCSGYNKIIIKTRLCELSWSITKISQSLIRYHIKPITHPHGLFFKIHVMLSSLLLLYEFLYFYEKSSYFSVLNSNVQCKISNNLACYFIWLRCLVCHIKGRT